MSGKETERAFGIQPHFAAAEKRVDELAEAIYKYTPYMHTQGARKLIKEFATEIIYQCRLVDSMYEAKEKTAGRS